MSIHSEDREDLARLENEEKDILNRYTELCIRKKDRYKELREEIERRTFPNKYPEFRLSDILLSDEKTMEDMLKLYMRKL